MSSNNNGQNLEIPNKPKEIEQVEEHGLGSVITIDRNDLIGTANNLKKSGYNLFLFVSGIDYPEIIKLTYRVASVGKHNTESIFVKTQVPKNDPVIDSLTTVWQNASWHEREAYDLFGIEFKGHPELERILMPDDWEGYPLRKDYSDDHMIVFPQFQKDKDKQKDNKAVAVEKEKSDLRGENDG